MLCCWHAKCTNVVEHLVLVTASTNVIIDHAILAVRAGVVNNVVRLVFLVACSDVVQNHCEGTVVAVELVAGADVGLGEE